MSWLLEWREDKAQRVMEINHDDMFRKMMVIVSSRMIIVVNAMHMRRYEVNAIDSNLLELKLWMNKDVWIRIIHSFCFIFGNGPDLQSVVSATSKMGFMERISYSNADGWWKHNWKLKCLRDLPSTESSFDWMHSKGWNWIPNGKELMETTNGTVMKDTENSTWNAKTTHSIDFDFLCYVWHFLQKQKTEIKKTHSARPFTRPGLF